MKSLNHYEIFEISADASIQEIKQAFKRMTMRYSNETHPEEFLNMKEIYEELTDNERRNKYDEGLRLGESVLSELEYLERALERDYSQIEWSRLTSLEHHLLDSERIANLLLESALLLNQTDKGLDYADRLNRHKQLTHQNRIFWVYLLRKNREHDKAIKELKIAIYEEEEKNLETLTLYGELLMISNRRTDAMKRYEKWIMQHSDRRILIWKSWLEAVLFWGQREQLKTVMSWVENRFTEEEQQLSKNYMNQIFGKAIEFQRFDSAYVLFDEYKQWVDHHLDQEGIQSLIEFGGVMEELEMAAESNAVPWELLQPVYEYLEYMKEMTDQNLETVHYSFTYLKEWLSEKNEHKGWIAKFCLLYPKSYAFLESEFDKVFNMFLRGTR